MSLRLLCLKSAAKHNHRCLCKQMRRNYFRITTALCRLMVVLWVVCQWLVKTADRWCVADTGWPPTWKTWKSRGIWHWSWKCDGI